MALVPPFQKDRRLLGGSESQWPASTVVIGESASWSELTVEKYDAAEAPPVETVRDLSASVNTLRFQRK